MLIKNNKHFNDIRFPTVGEVIESYDKMICLGELFYLCQYNELFIPLKEADIEHVNQLKNGQLSLL